MLSLCRDASHFSYMFSRYPLDQQMPSAKFLAQQSASTICICSIVEHDVSRSLGEATTTARHRAREIATFSRLRQYRNSICRGRSSPDEVAIEISTTADSWPWNLSTVPMRAPSGNRFRSKFTCIL